MSTSPDTTLSSPIGGYNEAPISAQANTSSQVQGSSYAALAGAIFTIGALMTDLGINYNKMSQTQTEAQNSFNQSARAATIKEGKEQRNQHYAQAGAAAVSAVVSIASFAGPEIQNQWGTEAEGQSLNSLRDEAGNNLKASQDQLAAAQKGEAAIKQNPNFSVAGEENDALPEMDGDIELARVDAEAGIFSDDPDVTQEAVESAGGDAPDLVKEAQERVDKNQDTLNSINNRMSARANSARLVGDMFKEGANAISQGLQSHFVMEAAVAKSLGMASQYNQQLSAQSMQTLMKEMSSMYSLGSSMLQGLAQVAAAAA